MFNPRSTIVRRVSSDHPDDAIIAEAADVIRRGGTVAFPTETVYGLGANALDAAAVEAIFAAKGRPASNPVIVHVASAAAAEAAAQGWPDKAIRLAERFWPGSLTLVVPKRSVMPDVVTAGGPTVGLRVPAHPVALALLRTANLPIAAPSANRSTRISPTTAAHVLRDLDGRIDLLLDAGPTPGGLESTVLDLTADPPRVLRPGLVSVAQLEAIIGRVKIGIGAGASLPPEPLRSPGLLPRHYAPRAKVVCVNESGEAAVQEAAASGKRVGWLRLIPSGAETLKSEPLVIDMPDNPAAYAAKLYAALHEFDDAGVECIIVDLPPDSDDWLAIHDRLRRASHNE